MANKPLLANDYADWFINRTDRAAGALITVPMIHKLVYFAQAWYLANKNRPLFAEDFIALSQGPALPSIQERFAGYYLEAVPEMDRTRLVKGEKLDLLEGIHDSYGCYSATHLETLVKDAGGPWHMARAGFSGEERGGAIIPKQSMKAHFAMKLEASRG